LNINYCEICRSKRFLDEAILSEIAHSENSSIKDWLKQLREGDDGRFKEVVMDYTRERMEEEAEKYGGELSDSDITNSFRSKVLPRDIGKTIEKYINQGDLVLEQGRIRVTRRGAIKVARIVKLKLENLNQEKSGSHKIKDEGFGFNLTNHSRKYEFGDTLKNIDVKKTLLKSLERNILQGSGPIISLKSEDFHVYEPTFEARMCIGLLIDESASMGDEKRSAAIDICLSLAKLKKHGDVLKVLVYSDKVKEIPFWEILNISMPGGTTDIKAALHGARDALKREKGDKQIYIITDAEPNTQDGKYVGFDKAIAGVKKEAILFKRDNITINIIMLENNPKLREFAAHLARINAGRIFFASPENMGEVVVGDYMTAKRSRR